MIKTKSLIFSGSIIIGTSFLMMIYFTLISLGVIQTRVGAIELETKSLDTVYDGKEHKMEDYVLKSGNLRDSHRIVINYTGSQTNAGETKNTAEVKIIDKNDNDVTRKYNIKVDYGTIRVAPRPMEFSTSDHEKIYDGKPIDPNERELKVESGSLVPGHVATQRIMGNTVNVGIWENRIEVNIKDEKGNDVTGNYSINYKYGQIHIKGVPITVQSASDNKVYDGTPLYNHDYEIIRDTPFPNHRIVVDVVGEIREVGKIKNEMHVIVVDEHENDVSYMYEINKLEGTLEVLTSIYASNDIMRHPDNPEKEIVMTVLGERTETVYLRDISMGNYNGSGWDYANIYQVGNGMNPLSYSGQALWDHHFIPSKLTINFIRKNIPYLTPYFSVDHQYIANDIHVYGPYDGGPYTTNYISYQFNQLNHYLINDRTIQSEELQYRKFVYDTYLHIDDDTKNELLKYAQIQGINSKSSTLIHDIETLIKNSAEYNMNFEPIPIDVENIVLYFLNNSKEGICQHFASAGVLMYRAFGIPARYVTGYLADVMGNQWTPVTNLDAHAWVEVYIDGMGWIPIDVTPGIDNKAPIYVEPKDRQGVYDGSPLVPTDVKIDGFEHYSEQGYTYEVVFGGYQIEPGVSESYIKDFIVYDPYGNDVTEQFSILTGTGELKVFYKKITFKTGDHSEVYRNEWITNQDDTNYEIVEGLMDGHYAVVEFTARQKDVGTTQNTAAIRIYNENGYEVTDLYHIIPEFGNLEVTPREIVIRTASATKPYDGTELVAHDFSIVSGSLNEGEHFDEDAVVYTGKQVGFGSSDNTIEYNSIRIYNEKDEDVTRNYRVVVHYGRLTVTPY